MRKVNQNYGAGSRRLGIFDFRFGIRDSRYAMLDVGLDSLLPYPGVDSGIEIRIF